MMICNGVRTQITHFRSLRISPLIFATVQKFALDYLRDQQILTPPCEWGWVVVVPLLGKALEVEDSPGMVWKSDVMCSVQSNHMESTLNIYSFKDSCFTSLWICMFILLWFVFIFPTFLISFSFMLIIFAVKDDQYNLCPNSCTPSYGDDTVEVTTNLHEVSQCPE